MSLLSTPNRVIDCTQTGEGSPVILLHASVSGNRQWRALTAALADRHQVIAPNLMGYGKANPWPHGRWADTRRPRRGDHTFYRSEHRGWATVPKNGLTAAANRRVHPLMLAFGL